jgi:hypothetical protein
MIGLYFVTINWACQIIGIYVLENNVNVQNFGFISVILMELKIMFEEKCISSLMDTFVIYHSPDVINVEYFREACINNKT